MYLGIVTDNVCRANAQNESTPPLKQFLIFALHSIHLDKMVGPLSFGVVSGCRKYTACGTQNRTSTTRTTEERRLHLLVRRWKVNNICVAWQLHSWALTTADGPQQPTKFA